MSSTKLKIGMVTLAGETFPLLIAMKVNIISL